MEFYYNTRCPLSLRRPSFVQIVKYIFKGLRFYEGILLFSKLIDKYIVCQRLV
jgi:hypothetical protein